MESVDIIKLIKEIEKRPEIWNTHSKEYSDRNRRKEAWFDICHVIIPNFTYKTELETDAIGMILFFIHIFLLLLFTTMTNMAAHVDMFANCIQFWNILSALTG